MDAYLHGRSHAVGAFSKELQKYLKYWSVPDGFPMGPSQRRPEEEASRIVKQYTPVKLECYDNFGTESSGGWFHGPDYNDEMIEGHDY